jgi:hypothetical protein
MAGLFAFLMDLNGGLKKAFAPTQPYDVVAAAKQLVADGVINNGQERFDPRYEAFFISLDRFNSCGYADAVSALDVLSAAGCKSAGEFRRSKGAEIMGYQHFQGKDYVPYVVEHTLSYLNGNDGVFRHMARYAESRREGIDYRGTSAAVNFLTTLPEGDWGAICLNEKLADAGIPPANTLRAWTQNPEIPKILRTDFRMFRASYLADNGNREAAYQHYTEAVHEGLSPRVDRDIWFRNMFAPAAQAG